MGASNDIDLSIAKLAEGQHGVVSRKQLRDLGLGTKAIDYRQRRRRLLRLHHGVYAVGHERLRPEGRWLAAVLAAGEGAVLSHRSAARLWGLGAYGSARVEVSIPRTSSRRVAGVRIYRHGDLRDDEVTEVDGVPTTTVARTLLDAAAVVRAHQLRRLAEQAEALELFDGVTLATVLANHPARPGTRALRALLDDLRDHGMTMTRSDLEALFLALSDAHGLTRPLVNHHHDGRELDFRWPAARLVVETNGYRYHRSRAAFERDHAKRFALEAAGYRVVSLTWRQVVDDPDAVFGRLRALVVA